MNSRGHSTNKKRIFASYYLREDAVAIKRLVVWKGQEKRGRGVNVESANKGPLKLTVVGFTHQKVYAWNKQC